MGMLFVFFDVVVGTEGEAVGTCWTAESLCERLWVRESDHVTKMA
jgi:hypothetical protein